MHRSISDILRYYTNWPVQPPSQICKRGDARGFSRRLRLYPRAFQHEPTFETQMSASPRLCVNKNPKTCCNVGFDLRSFVDQSAEAGVASFDRLRACFFSVRFCPKYCGAAMPAKATKHTISHHACVSFVALRPRNCTVVRPMRAGYFGSHEDTKMSLLPEGLSYSCKHTPNRNTDMLIALRTGHEMPSSCLRVNQNYLNSKASANAVKVRL